jgi:hypothetical protein
VCSGDQPHAERSLRINDVGHPMVSLMLEPVAKGEAGIVMFEIKTLTNVCQIITY